MGRLNARNIDNKILERFKIEVIRRHGKLHGAFSQELTKALQLYLDSISNEEGERDISSKVKKVKIKPRGKRDNFGVYASGSAPEKLYLIMAELKRMGLIQQALDKDIRVSITRTIGTDPKVVKWYMRLLQDYGFIKPHPKNPIIFNLNGYEP